MTVVDFLPLKEADDAFRAWLAEHKLARADIGERNIVIDTAGGEAGPVSRYRVHRDAVPRSTDVKRLWMSSSDSELFR